MDNRESTTVKGRLGESRALALLRERGYRIVEQNYRCRSGELDIVARDRDDTLVFVEVRTRAGGDRGSALDTVGPAKQAQIARVAQLYLLEREPRFRDCRFDVVGITGDEATIVVDAFRPGLP
jgi:putative endonuclease